MCASYLVSTVSGVVHSTKVLACLNWLVSGVVQATMIFACLNWIVSSVRACLHGWMLCSSSWFCNAHLVKKCLLSSSGIHLIREPQQYWVHRQVVFHIIVHSSIICWFSSKNHGLNSWKRAVLDFAFVTVLTIFSFVWPSTMKVKWYWCMESPRLRAASPYGFNDIHR